MLLRCFLICLLQFFLIHYTCGQLKGRSTVGLWAGTNFSNFINSEAPEKEILGSDPFRSYDYTIDYSTSIIRDMKAGLNLGVSFEYFLSPGWSLKALIKLEERGIHLDYRNSSAKQIQSPADPVGFTVYQDEVYERKIQNRYLVLPVLLRRHFNKKNIYLQGGAYIGYLLKSEASGRNESSRYLEDGTDWDWFKYRYEHEDKEKEFTSVLDFGLSGGLGHKLALHERWELQTDLLMSVGLVKLDRKHDNGYKEEGYPIRGGNYYKSPTNYYGLNSRAKNLNLALSLGIIYLL